MRLTALLPATAVVCGGRRVRRFAVGINGVPTKYRAQVTLTDDHGTLAAHAARLCSHLDAQNGVSTVGSTMHMQHVEFATRVRQLSNHLGAAIALSRAYYYPSALVVVRAALDHHLLDRLLFLGRHYLVTYGGIGKEKVEAEYARLAALKAGERPDIARYWWDDSGMNVVIRGLHSARSKKGRGRTLSPYYFQIDQFDPFTGGKTYATDLAAPFWERAHREAWAAEAASTWREHFRHDRVVKALRANRLLPGMEYIQVDVHYKFLSGFAHPTKRGYDAVWGRNSPDRMGSFDHYASELVLLYVITLAACELDAFRRMASREPKLGLRSWDQVEHDVRAARLASSYFWFLGGEPTMFDRIETVHTPPSGRDPRPGRPRYDPRTIKRVRYYADPMDRLVRLHSSFQELMTGLVYQSPFERPDARLR